MGYALKFDGSQNYVDLGKMNGFGGGLGAGFYARFYIKTTGTAAEGIGYQQSDFRVTIGLNQSHLQANVSGALNLYLADLSGVSLVAGTTTSTGFNDGNAHLVEVTVSGNTLTIAVDGNSQAITYNVHNTPATFANFANDGFMIMDSHTLACTIDDLWLGYTASNIYAKYLFGEGSGTTSADSLRNSTIGVLKGNPLPQRVAPLTPVSPKGSGINLVQVGSVDISPGQATTEQSLPVTMAYDQPPIPVVLNDSARNEIDAISIANAIGDGSKNVTTSGTAVQLITSVTPCKNVTVCAKMTNTGVIAVGASSVVAASSTRRGIPLSPGDAISIDINDVSKIYIDSTVSAEGVTFIFTS